MPRQRVTPGGGLASPRHGAAATGTATTTTTITTKAGGRGGAGEATSTNNGSADGQMLLMSPGSEPRSHHTAYASSPRRAHTGSRRDRHSSSRRSPSKRISRSRHNGNSSGASNGASSGSGSGSSSSSSDDEYLHNAQFMARTKRGAEHTTPDASARKGVDGAFYSVGEEVQREVARHAKSEHKRVVGRQGCQWCLQPGARRAKQMWKAFVLGLVLYTR